MHILLVEDHRLVADALQVMLQELGTHVTVTACYSSQHALSIIDDGENIDLIITDLFMPGIDGLGLLMGIKNRDSNIPVIVISGSDEDKYIQGAINNGASGYVNKSLPGIEMLAGVKAVLAGKRYFPERFTVRNPRVTVTKGKTVEEIDKENGTKSRVGDRQQQVLKLMAAGNSNKQISQIIGISEATVKYHMSQLFKTLVVKNRTSCVREALSRGYLQPSDTTTL